MDFSIIPTAEASVVTLMQSVNRVIINPLIILLFALAVVYFIYGLTKYLLSPENEEIRKTSKSHMLWGIIGMFIMISVFGIMNILLNTLGENRIKVNSTGDYSIEDIIK
jgi:predicted PurR-regulated permease PerM